MFAGMKDYINQKKPPTENPKMTNPDDKQYPSEECSHAYLGLGSYVCNECGQRKDNTLLKKCSWVLYESSKMLNYDKCEEAVKEIFKICGIKDKPMEKL